MNDTQKIKSISLNLLLLDSNLAIHGSYTLEFASVPLKVKNHILKKEAQGMDIKILNSN